MISSVYLFTLRVKINESKRRSIGKYRQTVFFLVTKDAVDCVFYIRYNDHGYHVITNMTKLRGSCNEKNNQKLYYGSDRPRPCCSRRCGLCSSQWNYDRQCNRNRPNRATFLRPSCLLYRCLHKWYIIFDRRTDYGQKFCTFNRCQYLCISSFYQYI